MTAADIAAVMMAAAAIISALTGLVVALRANSKAKTAVNGTMAASHVPSAATDGTNGQKAGM